MYLLFSSADECVWASLVCSYLCTYMCICICTCLSVCVCVCVCACVCVCVCMYVNMLYCESRPLHKRKGYSRNPSTHLIPTFHSSSRPNTSQNAHTHTHTHT